MIAQITRITMEDDGSSALIVPGTEPEQIMTAAMGELDTDELIHTSIEDVEVGWWRVNPCHPSSCYETGGHNGHWVPTLRQTRGGFQAAAISVGYES